MMTELDRLLTLALIGTGLELADEMRELEMHRGQRVHWPISIHACRARM